MTKAKTKEFVATKKAEAVVPSTVSDAARQFMKLVGELSYQQGAHPESRGLTNLTFWAGAGFSKSWDPKAPVGSKLFTLDSTVIERVADTGALQRMLGLSSFNNTSSHGS